MPPPGRERRVVRHCSAGELQPRDQQRRRRTRPAIATCGRRARHGPRPRSTRRPPRRTRSTRRRRCRDTRSAVVLVDVRRAVAAVLVLPPARCSRVSSAVPVTITPASATSLPPSSSDSVRVTSSAPGCRRDGVDRIGRPRTGRCRAGSAAGRALGGVVEVRRDVTGAPRERQVVGASVGALGATAAARRPRRRRSSRRPGRRSAPTASR